MEIWFTTCFEQTERGKDKVWAFELVSQNPRPSSNLHRTPPPELQQTTSPDQWQLSAAGAVCTRHATSIWQGNAFSAAIGAVPKATQ